MNLGLTTRLTTLSRHLLARPAARAPAPAARPHTHRFRAMASGADASASLDKSTPDTKWKELLSAEEVKRGGV